MSRGVKREEKAQLVAWAAYEKNGKLVRGEAGNGYSVGEVLLFGGAPEAMEHSPSGGAVEVLVTVEAVSLPRTLDALQREQAATQRERLARARQVIRQTGRR